MSLCSNERLGVNIGRFFVSDRDAPFRYCQAIFAESANSQANSPTTTKFPKRSKSRTFRHHNFHTSTHDIKMVRKLSITINPIHLKRALLTIVSLSGCSQIRRRIAEAQAVRCAALPAPRPMLGSEFITPTT